MPIAELNIGRIRYPLDDPRMAEFADNLARVNALADRSPGFVWRMTGADDGNNMDTHFDGAPDMNLNLSVWESIEALETYVRKTIHDRFLARKEEWFVPLDEAWFVMWRVPEGHRPSLEEAFERLDHLRAHGPTAHATGWDGAALLAGT